MQKEIKGLLGDKIKAVRKSRIAVFVGMGMIVSNIVLVIIGILSPYLLLFIFPLMMAVKRQINDLRAKLFVLTIARTVVDKKFIKTLNINKNEI